MANKQIIKKSIQLDQDQSWDLISIGMDKSWMDLESKSND